MEIRAALERIIQRTADEYRKDPEPGPQGPALVDWAVAQFTAAQKTARTTRIDTLEKLASDYQLEVLELKAAIGLVKLTIEARNTRIDTLEKIQEAARDLDKALRAHIGQSDDLKFGQRVELWDNVSDAITRICKLAREEETDADRKTEDHPDGPE